MGNARNIAFWVVLFLLILALFNLFSGNQSTMSSRTLSYSEFISRVDSGEVQSVTLDGERVLVRARDGSQYVTIKPDGEVLTDRLISKGVEVKAEAQELKRFLRKNLYQHYQVNRMTSKARRIITDLFNIFLSGPQLLPPDYQVAGSDVLEQARKVADYIAGMTDRYAMREYRRLFAVDEI
mgnify:CR=1 FL=1